MVSKKDIGKKVFLRTFGCQMAEYDSVQFCELLREKGYVFVDRMDKADIVLFNTCTVRQQIEDRVLGRLKELADIKACRKDLVIGVLGCLAHSRRDTIFTDFPHIDFIAGTREYPLLPFLIDAVFIKREKEVAISEESFNFEYPHFYKNPERIKTFVPIMRGCDNFCSYCVVPFVRGREISRAKEKILAEIAYLVSQGVRGITLLGQNVNSYGKGLDSQIDFPDLLEEIGKIKELAIVRFMTSHPKDISKRLFQVMRDCENIEKHLHLPLQSGSDRLLQLMNRMYTVDEYYVLVREARTMIPELSITTDLLVGFPGETIEDHELTKQFYQKAEFDDAFFFKYSARPGTAAYGMRDDVKGAEKQRRLQDLLQLQKIQTKEKRKQLLGKKFRALVESTSSKDPGRIQCRTWEDREVVTEGTASEIGTIITVQLTTLVHDTFIGKRV
jgi:tRNA-2-methylthio-N6-dimethylallyladenosine synthase